MSKTKKKTTRITKAERLRMAAEVNRPVGVRVMTGGDSEVEVTPIYDDRMNRRMTGVRADYWGDPDYTAAPTVYMGNPQDLRTIAAALIQAAEWMEETSKA